MPGDHAKCVCADNHSMMCRFAAAYGICRHACHRPRASAEVRRLRPVAPTRTSPRLPSLGPLGQERPLSAGSRANAEARAVASNAGGPLSYGVERSDGLRRASKETSMRHRPAGLHAEAACRRRRGRPSTLVARAHTSNAELMFWSALLMASLADARSEAMLSKLATTFCSELSSSTIAC